MVTSWGNNYSPEQLLDVCTVNAFDRREKLDRLITQILAVMAVHQISTADPITASNELIKNLTYLLDEAGRVSVGSALEELHNISTLPAELNGGRDGLDALCYHLSGHCCKQGIEALQKVLQRFEELEAAG